jgi:hypothetical protein
MKRSHYLAFIISIATTIILSFYINKITLRGAQAGGDIISNSFTLQANIDPDKSYWNLYPFSFGFALIVGIVVFILVYLVNTKFEKRNK